jgi:hypothetical protein
MKIIAYLLWSAVAFAETRPAVQTEWSGMLVDGGCHDLSLENLRSQPVDALAKAPPTTKENPGIAPPPKQVLQREQAEALRAHTPDHASRYSSAACAVTGDTTHFALLLGNGVLLILDEGGNTFAFDAFQNTQAGQEILNGKVGGWKPAAVVRGVRSGDRLWTRSVRITNP